MRIILIIAITQFFFGSHCFASSTNSAPSDAVVLIQPEEILRVNQRMKSLADVFVKSARTNDQKAKLLKELLFDKDKLALRYDDGKTKTAIETVATGSGNCISLASAYIALGRYLGLDVQYLSVQVPENWRKSGDNYIVSRHTTAKVKINRIKSYIVEFRNIFLLAGHATETPISDETAFAEYYNNIGVEYMEKANYKTAELYFIKATELDPQYIYAWSNLGITYRKQNLLDRAESAYRKALAIDRENLSTLNNLAKLLEQSDRGSEAKKIRKKLESYYRRNPFYLIELAESSLRNKQYRDAIKLAKKAIKKLDDEGHFYFVLARAYAGKGDIEKARQYLQQAEQHSLDDKTRNLYQSKLELLKQNKAS